MWLAVDSGNTRIKWALLDGQRIIMHSAAAKTACRLPLADNVSAVWVAHVGSAADLQRLQKMLAGRKNVRFLKSRRHAADVHNCYQPPSALGVDRWLCLLAARQMRRYRKRSVLVVSAGTAITADILLANGKFCGGIILPGLTLMPAALNRATPLPPVTFDKPPAAHTQLPHNTETAIRSGALWAAAGAIMALRRHHAPGARLLLTGGDAPHLQPYLPAAQLEPQLIFHGMACLHSPKHHA